MTVWRIQVKTATDNIGQYCLDNNVAAIGWSLRDLPQEERQKIVEFDDFKEHANYTYDNKWTCVKRMHNDLKCGDLIWMHCNGKYYFSRVSEESKWQFNSDEDARKNDAANQITNIYWHEYEQSDESNIPGAITTSFIKGAALQRIRKEGIEEFSQFVYNKIVGKDTYNVNIKMLQKSFYSLLTTDDCEDLLCLWLFKKYGYVCIPSTNKRSTQLYECVLLDPKNAKHIYVQVKKGNVDIDANEYKNLDGEVWFLTTEGQVFNCDGDMHIADPKKLYEYAISEDSDKIMSPSIKEWASFLKQNK